MIDGAALTQELLGVRSVLFAPGHDRRKLTKALESEADAVVGDLEDSVPEEQKEAARATIADVFGGATRSGRIVRINGTDTGFASEDLAVTRGLELDAVMLPKADPEALAGLERVGVAVIAIVETAWGLRLAYETAKAEGVAALALGAADLGAELGLEHRRDGAELLFARSKLVVDSFAAGLRSPIDSAFLDIRDATGLEEETRLARSLGLRAKLCVHPSQVATVNRAFRPSPDEVAFARRVIEAYERAAEEGRGVTAVDGRMVDAPVVAHARATIAGSRST